MTGKRLLDLAALFKASREVAHKHIELRQRQWINYSKTSSLTRHLRGVTTVVNGSPIHQRGTTQRNTFSTSSRATEKGSSGSEVPSPKGIEAAVGKPDKEGLEQDHFYTHSGENSTLKHPPNSKLGFKQDKAARYPLPDGTTPPNGVPLHKAQTREGISALLSQVEYQESPFDELKERESLGLNTLGKSIISNPEQNSVDHNRVIQRQTERQIPSEVAKPPPTTASSPDTVSNAEPNSPLLKVDQEQDVFYSPDSASEKVLSALPRAKVPKTSGIIQEGDPHVSDKHINQDVFYSSADPADHESGTLQGESTPEEQLSEEQYSEIFHSPKIKNLLRKNLESTERNLPDPKSPWNQQKRSFATSRKAQVPKDEPSRDVKDLAADIAKDAQASANASSEVSKPF